MKVAALLATGVVCLVLAVSACPSIPSYTPPQVPDADDRRVWGELVDAGCMSGDDDAGPADLDQAHARIDQPSWLACLYADGGTVLRCSAPCSPATTLRFHPRSKP